MELQEFTFNKKGLERLNEIKRNHENIYDDGIAPDCKCPYGDVGPRDCEDLCRLNHK